MSEQIKRHDMDVIQDGLDFCRTDEQLRRRNDELAILNRIGRQVSAELDVQQVASAAISELQRALSPDVVLLYLLKDGELLLIDQFARGGFFYEAKQRHRVGECLCGLAGANRKAVFSPNIHGDFRCTHTECKDAGIQSFAALPLISGERLLGVVSLAYMNSIDLADRIPFLEALASQIAIGIMNAELHEELKRHAVDLEEKVVTRTAELRHALERAQESDRMKSVFLSSMSHELRTPLNSIIGFTGILMQELAGPLNPDQKKQMSLVQNSSRQLLRLINDILDVARIEAGRLELSRELFSVDELVNEVVAGHQESAAQKSIAVKRIPSSEVHIVCSDRKRFAQIVSNLVGNAVKFTEQGEVGVRLRKDDTWLVIEVADTGIGISEENRDTIFTDFFQIDSGLTRVYSGAGLGLSLSRRLVKLLGGSIAMSSRGPGRGTTFIVRVPYDMRQSGDRKTEGIN